MLELVLGEAGELGSAGPPGVPVGDVGRFPRAAALTPALMLREGEAVDREQLKKIGPIDYVVLEWPKQQPVGESAASPTWRAPRPG